MRLLTVLVDRMSNYTNYKLNQVTDKEDRTKTQQKHDQNRAEVLQLYYCVYKSNKLLQWNFTV